jgi:hypothetical protein
VSGCLLECDVVSEGLELGDEVLVAVPDAAGLAFLEGTQVAVAGADRGHRGVPERLVGPARACAGPAGALLAGGAVVARALPGPRGQVSGGGEHAR